MKKRKEGRKWMAQKSCHNRNWKQCSERGLLHSLGRNVKSTIKIPQKFTSTIIIQSRNLNVGCMFKQMRPLKRYTQIYRNTDTLFAVPKNNNICPAVYKLILKKEPNCTMEYLSTLKGMILYYL